MRLTPVFLAIAWHALTVSASANTSSETVRFTIGDTAFASILIRPDSDHPLPGVFMVPSWMGPNDNTRKKAARVAEMGYVVYLADLYSENVRPTSPAEAAAAAGKLREDRALMRQRTLAALEHFRSIAPENGVAENQFAAIGFCFGGGAILELARTGAPLGAFVSFHGDLQSPTLTADSDKIAGKVLVLHGADDPAVPDEDVRAFQNAMRATEVDWQFVSFGGAVHSFTDPTAANPGRNEYNETVANRAFSYMRLLFDEVFSAAKNAPGR